MSDHQLKADTIEARLKEMISPGWLFSASGSPSTGLRLEYISPEPRQCGEAYLSPEDLTMALDEIESRVLKVWIWCAIGCHMRDQKEKSASLLPAPSKC